MGQKSANLIRVNEGLQNGLQERQHLCSGVWHRHFLLTDVDCSTFLQEEARLLKVLSNRERDINKQINTISITNWSCKCKTHAHLHDRDSVLTPVCQEQSCSHCRTMHSLLFVFAYLFVSNMFCVQTNAVDHSVGCSGWLALSVLSLVHSTDANQHNSFLWFLCWCFFSIHFSSVKHFLMWILKNAL